MLFSGSDVEGEGEHKIMEQIRHYKSSTAYKPDTKYCIYGLDADLIMLSLILHEPNIIVLRDEEIFGKRGAKANIVSQFTSIEFIYISVLREYLEMEFNELKTKLRFRKNLSVNLLKLSILKELLTISFFYSFLLEMIFSLV